MSTTQNHILLDAWRGTDGYFFYSRNKLKPFISEAWKYRTKWSFEDPVRQQVFHVWSREDMTYEECRKIAVTEFLGTGKRLVENGQVVE